MVLGLAGFRLLALGWFVLFGWFCNLLYGVLAFGPDALLATARMHATLLAFGLWGSLFHLSQDLIMIDDMLLVVHMEVEVW